MNNKKQRILIAGANGFIGKNFVLHLKKNGYDNVFAPTRQQCDLMDYRQTIDVFVSMKPDIVFHCAGTGYGIGGKSTSKAQVMLEHLMINTHIIDASHKTKAKKIIAMGSAAIYPMVVNQYPISESCIFDGPPNPNEDSYAGAKRMLLTNLKAYGDSYNMEWVYIVACNLYGPLDNFHSPFPSVIPALINKFAHSARLNTPIEVWGDGSPTKDFMFINDFVRLAELLMVNGQGPYNIGTGKPTTIREVVDILGQITGCSNNIIYDPSKPNSANYRAFDLQLIENLGFQCQFNIEQGLAKTYKWYIDNYA